MPSRGGRGCRARRAERRQVQSDDGGAGREEEEEQPAMQVEEPDADMLSEEFGGPYPSARRRWYSRFSAGMLELWERHCPGFGRDMPPLAAVKAFKASFIARHGPMPARVDDGGQRVLARAAMEAEYQFSHQLALAVEEARQRTADLNQVQQQHQGQLERLYAAHSMGPLPPGLLSGQPQWTVAWSLGMAAGAAAERQRAGVLTSGASTSQQQQPAAAAGHVLAASVSQRRAREDMQEEQPERPRRPAPQQQPSAGPAEAALYARLLHLESSGSPLLALEPLVLNHMQSGHAPLMRVSWRFGKGEEAVLFPLGSHARHVFVTNLLTALAWMCHPFLAAVRRSPAAFSRSLLLQFSCMDGAMKLERGFALSRGSVRPDACVILGQPLFDCLSDEGKALFRSCRADLARRPPLPVHMEPRFRLAAGLPARADERGPPLYPLLPDCRLPGPADHFELTWRFATGLPPMHLVRVKVRNLHPSLQRRGCVSLFLKAAGYAAGTFEVMEECLPSLMLSGWSNQPDASLLMPGAAVMAEAVDLPLFGVRSGRVGSVRDGECVLALVRAPPDDPSLSRANGHVHLPGLPGKVRVSVSLPRHALWVPGAVPIAPVRAEPSPPLQTVQVAGRECFRAGSVPYQRMLAADAAADAAAEASRATSIAQLVRESRSSAVPDLAALAADAQACADRAAASAALAAAASRAASAAAAVLVPAHAAAAPAGVAAAPAGAAPVPGSPTDSDYDEDLAERFHREVYGSDSDDNWDWGDSQFAGLSIR